MKKNEFALLYAIFTPLVTTRDPPSSPSYYKIQHSLPKEREREREDDQQPWNGDCTLGEFPPSGGRQQSNFFFFFFLFFFSLFLTPRKGLTNDACEFFISRNKTKPLRAFLVVGGGGGEGEEGKDDETKG